MEGVKRTSALARATAKAAFNLLEGYINGLGYDISITRPQLTREEKIKLTEWDEERAQSRRLSLREKIIQYPKIALNMLHPPLQENNCLEIKKIIEIENNLRHALIHPTPLISENSDMHVREAIYFQLKPKEVGDLCDLVIELIDKICKTIGEKFGKVDFWLHRRDETGRFPQEAFL